MDQIVSRLWDPIASRVGYIVNLQENFDSLKIAMNELKCIRDDLKRKVDVAEKHHLKRTNHVQWWLESVGVIEGEVNAMEEAFRQMMRFLGNRRPNFWSGYQLGKRVVKKLEDVIELKNKGISFDVVAEKSLPNAVEEKPSTSTIGMDLMLENVLRLLLENEVGVVGIYGTGGVGKTTLLKRINNELVVRPHDFDFVIWALVSKEVNVGKIQKDIGDRLGSSWQGNERDERRAMDIYKSLNSKKFMLLLDDLWEMLDLEVVGIPQPNSQNKSKIVFTTRSEQVCARMDANRKVRVECLSEKEAWDLFQLKVGEEAMNSHPEIPTLAETVAKECKGLPLALITIGRAMACKKTVEEWKHAISVLSTSKPPSEISGMDDQMLLQLKFSYDNLRNNAVKSCFLYCSLFPEDYSINKERLIDYWIAEGFLDDDDLDEARNKGHDLIGSLKVACLLESGSNEKTEVKMHDVIRDLALWIASECGKKKKWFLVKAGVGLREAPDVERWKDAERISLMENQIESLTGTPICPSLLTLMLQWNSILGNVTTTFFQSMLLLKVLDLSNTKIVKLPAGIGSLVQLQYLNLSYTKITSLSEEIGNLKMLKHLDLEGISSLRRIPHGLISNLSALKVLKLLRSYRNWEGIEGRGGLNITELESMPCLGHLEMSIETVPALEMFIRSPKLLKLTQYLQVKKCRSMRTSTQLSSIFEVMTNLRWLAVDRCEELEEMIISSNSEGGDHFSISSLERLFLWDLSKLNTIQMGCGQLQNLRLVRIIRCHKLKNISWILQLEGLEEIHILRCDELEQVIETTSGGFQATEGRQGRLKHMELHRLPKLTSICCDSLALPSFEVLKVFRCPELKKLPLGLRSSYNTLREIRGAKEWWDGLEWEDDAIKSTFLTYFRETNSNLQ